MCCRRQLVFLPNDLVRNYLTVTQSLRAMKTCLKNSHAPRVLKIATNLSICLWMTKSTRSLLKVVQRQTKPRKPRERSKATSLATLQLNTTTMRPAQQMWTQILRRLWTKWSDEKMKQKLLSCTRPANCENVTATKVNPEVWSIIRSSTRSRNLKFQRLQNIVQKAMVPLIKLTDQSKKPEVSAQQLWSENVARTLLDAIALLGDANSELIQRRRDLIRPDLNNQYQQICAEHVGFNDLLFDISATNRMG